MIKQRYIIAILMLLLPIISSAQQVHKERIKLNAGLKVGFHAYTYNSTSFGIEGYEYDDRIIQSNKIGYSVSPFIRISRKRLYLQTETTFSLSNHHFEFKGKPTDDIENDAIPQYTLKAYSLQVPLLVGYHFVKSGPYLMSFFTGPKANFTFTAHDEQEFKHFIYEDLHDDIRPLTFYWEIGLGVSISNFCFDFTYDIGFNNNTRGITSKEQGKIFPAKRTDNQLSFSVGIEF